MDLKVGVDEGHPERPVLVERMLNPKFWMMSKVYIPSQRARAYVTANISFRFMKLHNLQGNNAVPHI